MGSALTARHYAVRGAEFLSEYLLFRALTLVRARSLFVDLDDGLTPSAPAIPDATLVAAARTSGGAGTVCIKLTIE